MWKIGSQVARRLTLIFMIVYLMTAMPLLGAESAVTGDPDQTILLGNSSREAFRYSAPAAADLNGNGYQEIVAGTLDGYLHVIAFNGGSWDIVWSRQTANDVNPAVPAAIRQPKNRIQSAPAIADIDADGELEIIVSTGGTPFYDPVDYNGIGSILVYEQTGLWEFTVKSGWPVIMGENIPDGIPDGIRSSPAVGDIDGDGDLEIVSTTYDRIIRAYHHDGTYVDGWPISRDNGDPILRGGESTAAIGDIDNDGLNEIVIGTFSPPWNGDKRDGPFPAQYNNPDYSLSTVWALNGDSSLVEGWPVITEMVVRSSPALGDIDGDGDLEVIVGTGDYYNYVNGRRVYAWHGDGTAVAGWPRPTSGNMLSSPALGDIDEDGILDVVIGCGGEGWESDKDCRFMYGWRGDGTNLPGFPVSAPKTMQHPPVLADIDGDDHLEIIQTSHLDSSIYVFQHNGKNANPQIDQSRTLPRNIPTTPLISDIDNDGILEMVVAGEKKDGAPAIFIFQESGLYDSDIMQWPQFHQNSARTGLLLAPKLTSLNAVILFHQSGSGNRVVRSMPVRNDGGGRLTWNLNASGAGDVSPDTTAGTLVQKTDTAVTLTIDLLGLSKDTLHDLGTLTLSATSPGLPVQNDQITIPVKVYIGDIESIYLPYIR
jgi:hypothetical protein